MTVACPRPIPSILSNHLTDGHTNEGKLSKAKTNELLPSKFRTQEYHKKFGIDRQLLPTFSSPHFAYRRVTCFIARVSQYQNHLWGPIRWTTQAIILTIIIVTPYVKSLCSWWHPMLSLYAQYVITFFTCCLWEQTIVCLFNTCRCLSKAEAYQYLVITTNTHTNTRTLIWYLGQSSEFSSSCVTNQRHINVLHFLHSSPHQRDKYNTHTHTHTHTHTPHTHTLHTHNTFIHCFNDHFQQQGMLTTRVKLKPVSTESKLDFLTDFWCVIIVKKNFTV